MPPTDLPPAATYRVQLSSTFTFDDLSTRVPYLAALGVTDLYLSPIYAARPGTAHGYDVVDHTRIDPQLGGEEGWRRLCDALRAHSLGVVLDVVPNHMAADAVHNRLWRQLLAEGPASAAARHFDVDWRPLTGLLRDKVLVPVLDEPYGAALLDGKVVLDSHDGVYRVRLNGMHLPVAADSVNPMDAEALSALNGDPQRLHDVLERQHYRLAYWRAANDEINYRRFFDVNELIAIHVEDEEVFRRSHDLVFRLAADRGVVRGLRVDHVDGLLEPAAYLARLRDAADAAWGHRGWIVVEKILERTEGLDPSWPVDGTTGYDALNALNLLFVSGRGVRTLRHFYRRLTGERPPFPDVAYECKRLLMATTLRSGLTILAHAAKRVADASWTTRDVSLHAITSALVELIASLTIYRTYLGESDRRRDREAIEKAFVAAVRRNPSMELSGLSFLRMLLLEPADPDPGLAAARRAMVGRLQQYTSSVHAKGVEDTAYYRDNPLLALNEVGGDPARAPGSVDEFHRFNHHRARKWPGAQTASSTHDTKLGEDARIRIGSLSVFANEWVSAVRAWRDANAALRGHGTPVDVNDEYRLYQVLIGVWPLDDAVDARPADAGLVDRVSSYMRKAVREARVHTSWARPNEEYEAAVDRFVGGILTSDAGAACRRGLRELAARLQPLSITHSVSQLVLKCTMPGVPDFYQGTESWAFWLTDPDNRRPVDFDGLDRTFRTLDVANDRPPAAVPPRDLKQFVAARLLRFRRDHQAFLARAGYFPIRAQGAHAAALVAFRRSADREHLVVAVPRLVDHAARDLAPSASPERWSDTALRLPADVTAWTDVLSSGQAVLDGPRMAMAQSSAPWIVLHGRR